MWTRRLWTIFLLCALLGVACGGDDDVETTASQDTTATETTASTTTAQPPEASDHHECIISEKYLRAELDIETFWPTEFMIELGVDWILDPPSVFKDLDTLLPGSVFLALTDQNGEEFFVALAPDRTLLFGDERTRRLEPGVGGALEALLAEDGQVSLPAGSRAPDGSVLPEGAIWSSDGSSVVVEIPNAPLMVFSPEDGYATRGLPAGEVIELPLPNDALLLSPGAAAARPELGSGPDSLPGTWFIDLGPGGIGSAEELEAMLGSFRHEIAAALDEQLAETLTAQAGEANYLEDITELRESYPPEIDVEPIYAMAFEGHWSLEPGAEPFQVGTNLPKPEVLTTVASDLDADVVVAIVDSGFPVGNWPGLAAVPLESSDTQDELGEESHGLFVASLIRQIAPTATMMGIRVETSGHELVSVGEGGSRPLAASEAALLTDEDSVVAALARLVKEFEDGWPRLVVVNLSLGTYACGPGTTVPPPERVRLALAALEAAAPATTDVRVYAAAGNESLEFDDHDSDAFYPAAFDTVEGVAALDANANLVTWDLGGARITSSSNIEQLDHVQHAVLGVDVIGAGRTTMGYWSGSSFATAAMSGLAAMQRVTDPDGSQGEVDPDQLKCPPRLLHARLLSNQDGVRTYDEPSECRP